jgi:hypothetical protein
MTTLIFYENPIPLNRELHRTTRLKTLMQGYRYAAASNSFPLVVTEFAAACHEYPIVFTLDETDGGIPIVLAGLHNEENLFVTPDGAWEANYIPAFVRRYPFVLHETNTEGDVTVMIDDAYVGFGAQDGELLFAADGTDTPLLTNVIDFMNRFNADAHGTSVFMKSLRQLDLLVSRKVDVRMTEDRTVTMDGFYVVDEARLAALSDTDLLALARNGELGLIHAHMLSLNSVENLAKRLFQKEALTHAG